MSNKNEEVENITEVTEENTKNSQEQEATTNTESDINAEKATNENAEKAEPEVKAEPIIETAEEKLSKMNDKYMRLSAEFDNYRKRTLKERIELMKSAGEDILKNFLPVIDNLERAKASADTSTDVEGVKEGLDLIFKNLSDFLSQRGIKEIDAMGKEFDTDIHEALTKIPAPSEELKGKVVDVIERGYTLNGKVIRFVKVVVGE